MNESSKRKPQYVSVPYGVVQCAPGSLLALSVLMMAKPERSAAVVGRDKASVRNSLGLPAEPLMP